MTKRQKRAAIANLNKMLKLFDKHGWIQGNYGDKDMGFCLLGANQEANGAGEMLARNAMSDKLNKTKSGYMSIPGFNDHRGRTYGEITAFVKHTIRAVEKQE